MESFRPIGAIVSADDLKIGDEIYLAAGLRRFGVLGPITVTSLPRKNWNCNVVFETIGTDGKFRLIFAADFNLLPYEGYFPNYAFRTRQEAEDHLFVETTLRMIKEGK